MDFLSIAPELSAELPMYPGRHAIDHPDRAAIVMAASGETVSFGELDRRSNRLAHLLRAHGLRRLDHYAVFMENHPRYAEACVAGERTGLYYTCISSYLTADELAYILDNSQAQLLITSIAKLEVACGALARCPRVRRCLVVGGAGTTFDDPRVADYEAAVAAFPDTAVDDERLGTSMLYSSGPPHGPGASCARCPTSRLPIRCRFSTLCTSCGARARG